MRPGVVMLVETAARLIYRGLLRIGRGKGRRRSARLGGGGPVQARGEATGGDARSGFRVPPRFYGDRAGPGRPSGPPRQASQVRPGPKGI